MANIFRVEAYVVPDSRCSTDGFALVFLVVKVLTLKLITVNGGTFSGLTS
jgi:hypothetical protein